MEGGQILERQLRGERAAREEVVDDDEERGGGAAVPASTAPVFHEHGERLISAAISHFDAHWTISDGVGGATLDQYWTT